MTGMTFDFFQEIGYMLSDFFGTEFRKLFYISLYVEKEVGRYVFSPTVFENVGMLIYSVATSLLLLKTLHKGCKIYLLNRDGDSEVSPVELLKGYVLAIVTALAFPILYDYLAETAMWIARKVSELIGVTVAEGYSLSSLLESISLLDLIMVLILFIFLLVLYFDFFKRGAELLILRMGMPLACLGLIDSDNGCFKPYIQQIFKCAITGIVQLFCIEVAVAIVLTETGVLNRTMSIIMSISFLMMAKATPTLLNQFMITSQGGGGLQKISSFAMTANAVRGFIK